MHCNGDVKKYILDHIVNGQEKVDLEKSTNLIEEGIIDSLGIMKLLIYLEETYDIHISDEELLPEYFESFNSITDMVENKLKAA